MIECGKHFDLKFKNSSLEIVEIFFDHFLASNWNKYSDLPLKTFSDNTYNFITNHKAELPLQY